MKKIISLVFVFVMLFACTVHVYAAQNFCGHNTIWEDVVYDTVYIDEDSTVSIWCNVKITRFLSLTGNDTIYISDGALIGENLNFYISGDNNKIELLDGGYINLTLRSISADRFEQLLKDSGIDYIRDGNHIEAGCCPHKTYDNGVCIACGFECPHKFLADGECSYCGMKMESTATGSTILSHGYPEIVFGVGGLAVGFFAAMLIFRKKKTAVSSASAENEE